MLLVMLLRSLVPPAASPEACVRSVLRAILSTIHDMWFFSADLFYRAALVVFFAWHWLRNCMQSERQAERQKTSLIYGYLIKHSEWLTEDICERRERLSSSERGPKRASRSSVAWYFWMFPPEPSTRKHCRQHRATMQILSFAPNTYFRKLIHILRAVFSRCCCSR